jgi:hypothetical protein
MPRKQIKFKFSAKELSFEYEGDLETGERLQKGIQESLGKLINTSSRVLPSSSQGDVIDAEVVPNGAQSEATGADAGPQQSRQGTRRQSRPRGTSVAARIKALHAEGYFAQEHSLAEVQKFLADNKGYTFKPNELSSALLQIVRSETLDRRQNDNGDFVYFNKAASNGEGGSGAVSGQSS